MSICFRLGSVGRYCVRKDKIRFAFLLKGKLSVLKFDI